MKFEYIVLLANKLYKNFGKEEVQGRAHTNVSKSFIN